MAKCGLKEGEEDDILARPVCLIETEDESGKFIIRESVLAQLRAIVDGEMVVVAIVGRYRSGKSYLMNRLFGQNTGFAVGSTVQAKTKGIWIWVRVHPVYPEKYLVLLDTEGLGDVEKDNRNHDDAISILATLLSSTLVFNNTGTIDYGSLTRLHFVSVLAKHLHSRGRIHKRFQLKDSSQEEESDVQKEEDDEDEDEEDEEKEVLEYDANNLAFKFPDFVYVIRDFDLELEVDGKQINADEYLENSLSVKPGSGLKATRSVKDGNRIKLCLRELFPRRRCFTFIRPLAAERMKFLDQTADDELDPEFIDNTGTFIHHIWENSCAKIINGRALSGKELSLLISYFVSQINSGDLLRVTDVVDVIRNTANKEALETALEKYVDTMVKSLKNLPISLEELKSIHSSCLEEALNVFHSKAVFLDDNSSFQTSLTDEISERFAEFVGINERERLQLCSAVLDQCFDEKISPNIDDGIYSKRGGSLQFRNDMDTIEQEYFEMLGPLADVGAMLRFREQHSIKESIFMQAEDLAGIEEEKAKAENLKALVAEQREAAAERESRLKTELMVQKETSHQQILQQLHSCAEEQQNRMRLDYAELERRKSDEQRRLLQEGFRSRASQLNAQIEALQRRL